MYVQGLWTGSDPGLRNEHVNVCIPLAYCVLCDYVSILEIVAVDNTCVMWV